MVLLTWIVKPKIMGLVMRTGKKKSHRHGVECKISVSFSSRDPAASPGSDLTDAEKACEGKVSAVLQ